MLLFLQTVTQQQQLESDITIDNYDLHLSSRNYILHLYTSIQPSYTFRRSPCDMKFYFFPFTLASRHGKETKIFCKVIIFGEIDKNIFSVSTRRHGEGAKFFVYKVSCFIRQCEWRRWWNLSFHSRGFIFSGSEI